MNKRLLVTSVLAGITCLAVQNLFACFAVVVGKNASTDGSVLLGHNEQNSGERFLNFRKIPRLEHPAGSVIKLRNGSEIPQVPVTYGFLWSQNPGCVSSDAYLNEFGVAIVSDFCPDRFVNKDNSVGKGKPDLSYMLRRLIIERARTAREAVLEAGKLIEQYGYPSCRTFVIADPDEAWLLSVTNSNKWVAQRVPDDKVVALPNVYIIGEVDLKDDKNFLACPDLVDYAVKQGWYDPNSNVPFRFDEAYSQPRKQLVDPRQIAAQSIITQRNINPIPDRRLPMCVTPVKQMEIKDVIRVLRYNNTDHNIGYPSDKPAEQDKEKKLCQTCPPESSHANGDISAPNIQETAVFQLRKSYPAPIGCVYWRISAEPSLGVLTPWYLGISQAPANYYSTLDIPKILAEEYHFSTTDNNFKPDISKAWWIFKALQDSAQKNKIARGNKIREVFNKFEDEEYRTQPDIDREAMELYGKDPASVAPFLTKYCTEQAEKAIALATELTAGFGEVK